MKNSCYHLYEVDPNKKWYSCIYCGHSPEPQDFKQVVCPNEDCCGEIFFADINMRVKCPECKGNMNAYENEVKIDYGKILDESNIPF